MKNLRYIILLIIWVNTNAIGFAISKDSLKVFFYIKKSNALAERNMDSALSNMLLAHKNSIDLKNDYLICESQIGLASLYQNLGDYKKSAKHFNDAITLAEKLKNKKLILKSVNGMANLLAIQKQWKQASELYSISLKLCMETMDTAKTAVVLMNMANLEYNKSYFSNDFIQTNIAYSKAYKWAAFNKDSSQLITCLGNWGMSLGDESKFDESLSKLNQAIRLATKFNKTSDLVFLNHYVGRTHGLMKQHDLAIVAFNKSLNLAIELKDLDFISENKYCLAESNYEKGNYKLAYDYFEAYKNLEDSLLNKETTNELSLLKTKYDTEKRQQEIEVLTANASKDKVVRLGLIIGSILILLLTFLLYNRYRLKSKTFEILKRQNEIISEKNKDISDSINYAKKIQEAILPRTEDLKKVFSSYFIFAKPKDVVSGDFYWFSQKGDLHYFVVADCTGHGVPGAFMSMIGNTLLNNIVNELKLNEPDKILNELRKEIIAALKQNETSSNKDGMDISLICFNKKTLELMAACANNPVWIIKKNAELIEIKPDKQPIGYVSSTSTSFTLHKMQLEKGDIIYQFTDGYADQFGGEKGKKFKYNQLKELLVKNHNLGLDQQYKIIEDVYVQWKGSLAQIDDILLTAIKV